MKKKIGIIIAVVVAIVAIVVGVIFLTQDKDPQAENPTEAPIENISQNDDANQDEETSTIMEETIDLFKVDLTKYGLTDDVEISVPHPTSLGCVYVVRDCGQEETQLYLFVTTKDTVMYHNTGIYTAGISVEGDAFGAFSLKAADLDGEKGEEIVFLCNTGGNGGRGIYGNGVYKIHNDKIEEMEVSDEAPFEVSLEAPRTVVFKNEKFDYEEKVVCDSDYESLFDEKGKPVAKEYDGHFFAPHEAEVYSDGEKTYITFTSYSYISRSLDENIVTSVVDYVYDANAKKFVVSNASIMISHQDDLVHDPYDEYVASIAYMNGYTYYDINKDGVDEFITHTGTCEQDRVYRIYTFADDKMYYAGEINGWHGAIYENDKNVVVISTGPAEEGMFVGSATYELIDNKLVEKEIIEKVVTEDEYSNYFDEFYKMANEIKVDKVLYK